MPERIFLSTPHMCGGEMKYIKRAFDTNWITSMGANLDEFERAVAGYVGVPYAVGLTSGTAAIHMALLYLGIGRGDIVFCSSLTFAASCNPIVYLGATPVFIDSDETYVMSPTALKRALRKYPRPKAIVTVNLYGQACDYDGIRAVAGDIPLVEDAAESLGTTYRGMQAGTFGEIGVLSFNGNKIITTSGGGMLLTRSEEAARKVKFWANQARDPYPWYEHTEIGYNYRLSNISAGIGLGQMDALNERIAKKRAIRARYVEALSDVIEFMPEAENSECIFWLTAGIIRDEAVTPARLLQRLEERNIEGRQVWKPMHMQPVYKDAEYFTAAEGEDVSARLFARGVCLPSDTKMTEEDMERVIGTCRSV